MRPDQRELLIRVRLLDGRAQGPVQVESRAKGAQRRYPVGRPAAALKDARQGCRELRRRERVEVVEGNHGE